MRKSRLSKTVQRRIIEHFVAGTPARYAAEIVGVNRNTTITTPDVQTIKQLKKRRVCALLYPAAA